MITDEALRITAAFPGLQVETIRLVPRSGQFSHVFVVNESAIFRFPRSAHVAREMVQEISTLRAIQGRVVLPVPDPCYVSLNPVSGAVEFMGYPMIPGTPLAADKVAVLAAADMDRMAGQLADFLKELHSVPLDTPGLAQSVNGTRASWEALYGGIRSSLFPFMRSDAQESVTGIFESALSDQTLWQFDPVMCHGDLGGSNILWDSETRTITGVIDFGFAGPGDPAQDLGAVTTLGEEFSRRLLARYPELQAAMPRAKFLRSTYALQQAYYGLRDGSHEEFEDGIRDYR